LPHQARPTPGDSPSLPEDEREARWALGLLPQLGGEAVKALLAAFGSARAAWGASDRHLREVSGLGPAAVQSMRGFAWRQKVRQEQARLQSAGYRVLVWGDPGYPVRLSQIHSPPPVLYHRGPLDLHDDACVAMVGARYATAYGESVATDLAGELARRGLTVVSGLARGIDAAAHRGALAVDGRTVGVLGCGLDRTYPPEHRELADAVAATGSVVSEFPLGTPPTRLNFPRRNRVISGLSLGVIVVEAGVESGALITAHHALEQGREVFAVPGRVHARFSEGCHRLIKDGAKLVETWEDVVAEMVPHLKGRRRPARPIPPPPDLTAEERVVFDLLAGGALHIDALIVGAGLPGGRVASALVGLEMKGVVRQLTGKLFERHDSP
jgi:DNA processing protein